MKNIIITLVLSTLVVSCGLSAEEQAALDSLNTQLADMTYESEKLDREAKYWWKAHQEEKDIYTRVSFGYEWERCKNQKKKVDEEITQIKFQISQIN